MRQFEVLDHVSFGVGYVLQLSKEQYKRRSHLLEERPGSKGLYRVVLRKATFFPGEKIGLEGRMPTPNLQKVRALDGETVLEPAVPAAAGLQDAGDQTPELQEGDRVRFRDPSGADTRELDGEILEILDAEEVGGTPVAKVRWSGIVADPDLEAVTFLELIPPEKEDAPPAGDELSEEERIAAILAAFPKLEEGDLDAKKRPKVAAIQKLVKFSTSRMEIAVAVAEAKSRLAAASEGGEGEG